MNWNEYKQYFEPEGTLRDLYVLDTDISHWQQLIAFLQQGKYQIFYEDEGNPVAIMPNDVTEIFERRKDMGVRMYVELGEILLKCHFFDESEIELDLHPSQINSAEDLNLVFEFMRDLGKLFLKKVILTPENRVNLTIFSYEPETDTIEYHPIEYY